MNDTTHDFTNKINQWQNYSKGQIATAADVGEMIAAAETAKSASGWMWPVLADLLVAHGGFRGEKAARREAKRCRIHADLGDVPYTAADFVEMYMASNGYTVGFSGAFSQKGVSTNHDRDYVGKKMKLWAEEMKEFTSASIDNALDVYMIEERDRIQDEAFRTLRFDPAADPDQTELARFVRLIVAEGDTAEETGRIYRAAEVSIANFIFRVKNHMRGVMKNSCHMMPIFQGRQGDGKTEVVKQLCKPLGELVASTSFDAFNDNSLMYQFSIMPVMIFEEMAGAGKADMEKLKALMTDTQRQMREAYARAGTRRIVSTFIATSNRDVQGLIKDETGNRRLIAFRSRPADLDAIRAIDTTKLWRSVDEDAVEPPKYANAEDLEIIQTVQEQQRFRSPVEDWIMHGDEFALPWGKATKALKLYDSFEFFMRDAAAGELRHWSARRLGTTVAELADAGRIKVRITKTAGSWSYAIQRPEGLEEHESEDQGRVIPFSKGHMAPRAS